MRYLTTWACACAWACALVIKFPSHDIFDDIQRLIIDCFLNIVICRIYITSIPKPYLHVRLAKAAAAMLGLQLLQLQHSENRPMKSAKMVLARAHDIRPWVALNQSET